MSTYQLVLVCGRLGRDPELKYLQTGTPVTNLSLATDESYKDKDGNKVQQTEWHKVNVFGKQAENVSKYLAKGSLALVEGKLSTHKWQDQQGNNRYSTEIKAQRVVFMGTSRVVTKIKAKDRLSLRSKAKTLLQTMLRFDGDYETFWNCVCN